ncbi:MAG: hypothetical protein JWM42_614, partial [Burkholderia sp.]|nr:hypothetical protein [Burkholderia sp.]
LPATRWGVSEQPDNGVARHSLLGYEPIVAIATVDADWQIAPDDWRDLSLEIGPGRCIDCQAIQ